MLFGKNRIRRRVWLFLALAVIAIGSWWMWNRSTRELSGVMPPSHQPTVMLAKTGEGNADQVLRERAEYFDPTPLFFPTALNYGQGALRESMRRQPGQVFETFGAKLVADNQITRFGNHGTDRPLAQLAEVVELGNEAPFSGFGENERVAASLPEREGLIEVRGLRDGKIVMVQILAGISLDHYDFAPTEFLLIVGAAGVVGEPVLVTGSGREEVDAVLRTSLVKGLRLGQKLSPGIYRILVGP